jgi:hypothetical protein
MSYIASKPEQSDDDETDLLTNLYLLSNSATGEVLVKENGTLKNKNIALIDSDAVFSAWLSTVTPDNWNLAYSHKITEDTLSGLVKVNGAGVYSAITDNSTNWNTAYSWGNHAGLYASITHGVTVGTIPKAATASTWGNSLMQENASGIGIGAAATTGAILDARGDLSLFGGTEAGYVYNYFQTINFRYNYDADALGYINYAGYQNGITWFRDLGIFDGKHNNTAYFRAQYGWAGLGSFGGATLPAGMLDIRTNSTTSPGIIVRTVTNQTALPLDIRDPSNNSIFYVANNSGGGLITSVANNIGDPTAGIATSAVLGFSGSTNNFYGVGLGAIRNGKYDIWFSTGAANGGGFRFYQSTNELMSITNTGGIIFPTYGTGIVHSSSAGLLTSSALTAAEMAAIFASNTNNTIAVMGGSNTLKNSAFLTENVTGVGIGTTAPGSKLTVSGHIGSLGTIPVLTEAGTGSSITTGSTDMAGEITEGTLATGAVITFANAYTNVPFAIVVSEAGLLFSYTVSTTAITITNIGALSSTKLSYQVIARE